MKDNNRIKWVDAAKGVGILMVMFGHNWLDWKYCYYFYSFHMPLFFILAGYTFSNRRTPWDFIRQKAKVLLIPYVLFVICNLLFYGALSYSHGGDYNMRAEALSFLLQQRHTYLWFLPVLFLSELLVYFISKQNMLIKYKTGGVIFSILITLHSLTVITNNVNWIWNLDLVPMASAFIILGHFYKKAAVSMQIETNNLVMIGLFLISFTISTVNFIVWDRVDIWGNSYGSIPLFYLGAIAATYSLILLLKRIPSPYVLIFLGVNSLLVYGLHRMVIEICFIIWNKIGVVYDGVSIVSLFIAVCNVVLTCVLLYPFICFINKKCPWLIGKF